MSVVSSKLLQSLADVTASDGHRYGLHDLGGNRMDCLSVCPDGHGSYLGVYHSTDGNAHLAWSKNLLDWAHVRKLSDRAVMPEIKRLDSGQILVAYEHVPTGKPNHVAVRRYPNVEALTSNDFDRIFDAPNTLSPWAEGTPSFRPGTTANTIKLGMHYLSRTGTSRDRQAQATITDWKNWKAVPYSPVQRALPDTTGGIGERSFLRVRGGCAGGYQVIERQGESGSFDNWSIWLYSFCTRRATRVPVKTHGGSPSVGNPNVARIKLPDGRPGIFVTYFLFTPRAAPGEGGPVAFVRADW